MIHLNLDPAPVPAGEIVALTPVASITSLGEVRVGRRRLQVRRSTATVSGRSTVYLVDARGNAFYLEPANRHGVHRATSRNTDAYLSTGGEHVRFRFDGDRLVVTDRKGS